MNENLGNETQFHFDGELSKRKLKEYLPAMIITNLSTLLLISVDGLVVGNLVGPDALSSVNIFLPATNFIGVLSALIASGGATCLSLGMGKIDLQGLMKTKSTLKYLMIVAAVFVGLIQIPIVALVIGSYHLAPDMNSLVWSYAVGVMISMPFGLISTVGVFQLQIVGKMKMLMVLACIEGGANLLLDLLFVGPLGMGVAGAGYGTAGANIIRCALTVLFLAKKTDIYYSGNEKPSLKEVGSILAHGLPDAANAAILALQNFAIVSIVLSAFGKTGGVIQGVCTFAVSIAMVFISGVQGAARPMTGLLCGAEDMKGLRRLTRQSFLLVILFTGVLLFLIELFPGILFSAHGVSEIPEGGLFSLRLMATHIVFRGLNNIFRLYFTNRKLLRFNTILTVAGNALLPLFAFGLSKLFPPVWLWLSYLMTETVILVIYLIRYLRLRKKDKLAEKQDEHALHLTVRPDEAVEISRAVRKYAEETGINRKFAFRVSLCLEEMAAYAVQSKKTESVSLQVMIRFFKEGALLMIIDDGQCTFLDREEEMQDIITTNYGVLKKISKSVEYQYILNLNYTVCRF